MAIAAVLSFLAGHNSRSGLDLIGKEAWWLKMVASEVVEVVEAVRDIA